MDAMYRFGKPTPYEWNLSFWAVSDGLLPLVILIGISKQS